MIFKNVTGQSYQLFPASLANPNDGSTIVSSKQTTGNKILFFAGVMPTPQEMLSHTVASISGAFTKLLETQEFTMTYTYTPATKKRIIRKTVIDAQELQYLAAGTIGFALIILNNPDATGEYFIATDSIGTWGENTMPIILDNKVGTLGSRNLFKNVSIEITDKSNYN